MEGEKSHDWGKNRGEMNRRVFPGSRSLLHSHLDQAGYSYVGTLGGDNEDHDDGDFINANCKFCRQRRPVCSIPAAGGQVQVFKRGSA